MTFVRNFVGFITVCLILFSCRKDMSNEQGVNPEPLDAHWEFAQSGKLYSGGIDSAYIETIGSVKSLSMIGSNPEQNNGEILLQVIGQTIQTGTYSTQYVFFQYLENGAVLFQSSPVLSSDFSLTIDVLDSASVSGTFSGTVLDAQGNTHTIADGKFTANIASVNNEPQPVQSGQLAVWTREICSDGGEIEIRVGGQSAMLSDGLSAEPACNAPGAANFTLLAGEYTLEAICTTDTIRYNITIISDCSVLEIDFENPPGLNNYLPLTLGSYWDYNDLANPSTTQRRTVDGEDVIEGRRYTRVLSDNGDTLYYYRAQNAYYEYRTLNYQEYVEDPPSLEMVILYDNYSVGQTWESQPENLNLSGIIVKAKLVSKIVRRDFTGNYNGVDYTDLIEVNTEIFFSSDNGSTYQTSGSSYNTVFAKDKGIVYYYDIDNSIEWGINNLFINP